MRRHSNAARELVINYLERFPNSPDLTVAKAIYAAAPELFKSVETARARVRYYRGTRGAELRTKISDKTHFVELGRSTNPFAALPEGIKAFDEWAPVMLTGKKTLVIGDLHVPYHDRNALMLALEHGYKIGVDAVLILGDFIDFYAASKWETDPRKRDLWKEIETGREVLKTIRSGFPKAKIYTKMGNHDERYERWLWVKAPELLSVPDFQYAKFMHFEQHRVELIASRRILKIGGLHLIHGHEFGRMFSDPVNPARGIYNRGKAHCLCAHWHRTSHHSETAMDGKTIGCWSIGSLCDPHPEYMPVNKWNFGHGLVDNLGGEEFLVANHTIVKGRVY